MGIVFCPGCGSSLLLETQRFCATCGFDLETLRDRAQQVQAAAESAEPKTDIHSPATGVARAGQVAPEAILPQPAIQGGVESVRDLEPERPPAEPATSWVGRTITQQPEQTDSIVTRPAEPTAQPRPAGVGARRRPLLALGGLVLVLAVAGVGYVVLAKLGPGSSQPQSLALASASLDPDAPAFPVPAGSTLINATIEGSGPAAYRLEAWQSGQGYDATANFYADLVYSGRSAERWQARGALSETPQGVTASFSDASSVFGGAELEVDRTDPVRIEVRLLPNSSLPAQSVAPGPTIAFGALPRASALPDGFPSGLAPSGTTLLDAGAIGSTYFALFSGSVDVNAYKSQIGSVVTITGTTTQSGSTVINFTLAGKAGQIVIDPASGEVSVEVTK